MVSFTINLEVMSSVGPQHNKPIRRWYEMQRSDANPVNVNGSKMISPFDKVVNDKPGKLNSTVVFRNNLKLFWSCVNVSPTL